MAIGMIQLGAYDPDNQTIDSDILQYYDFISINNKDGGYVELVINPLDNTDHKYVNG